LPDYREPASGESEFVEALQGVLAQPSEEEQRVPEGRLRNESLEEIARSIGRSPNTVSNRLARLRSLLESA
jgi:hypothetical protein